MLIDKELDHVLLTLQDIGRRVEAGVNLTETQVQKVLDIKDQLFVLRDSDVIAARKNGQSNPFVAAKWRLSTARVSQLHKEATP